MPLLALKIDIDTYRGTREGVPQLLAMLQRHHAGATFLFSLGPDHTGRALRRAFRPGFMKKVSRTSVLEHYGLKTLLYGTLLPGPDIGRKCADILRGVRDAGFETGIHTFDHVKWQDYVADKDAAWTEREMARAMQRYTEIFGQPAATHGAAGWQMNEAAYRQEQRWDMAYCSDTRGTHPFIPLLANGDSSCPQLPTTLPTLDELIGADGISVDNVAGHILALTRTPPAHGHVYTLHAELEGMKLAPVFEQLLTGWQRQGYTLVSMAEYYAALDVAALPREAVTMGEIAGRSGTLAMQG
jgi:peptidoglycan/xylan/chitin deacetylase (PgdA/CDA1 family)